MSHLGTLLAIATTESAMAAMSYDKAIRTAIETASRKRISDTGREKLIAMLTEEHDATKKAILRDVAASNDQRTVKKPFLKGNLEDDHMRHKGKANGPKGNKKGKKGEQKGHKGPQWHQDPNRFQGKNNRTPNGDWWQSTRWNNNWDQNERPQRQWNENTETGRKGDQENTQQPPTAKATSK